MTTIYIVPEVTNEQTVYRAICGSIQTTGFTPGQALDSTLQTLTEQGDTVVILQRFCPDDLFTGEQQKQLVKQMEQFHKAVDTGKTLSPQQQQELENLVETELEAALTRSARILNQSQSH